MWVLCMCNSIKEVSDFPWENTSCLLHCFIAYSCPFMPLNQTCAYSFLPTFNQVGPPSLEHQIWVSVLHSAADHPSASEHLFAHPLLQHLASVPVSLPQERSGCRNVGSTRRLPDLSVFLLFGRRVCEHLTSPQILACLF